MNTNRIFRDDKDQALFEKSLGDAIAGRTVDMPPLDDPKPFLTKFGFGRWWFYVDTRRKWRFRSHNIIGWPLIVISYRKTDEAT